MAPKMVKPMGLANRIRWNAGAGIALVLAVIVIGMAVFFQFQFSYFAADADWYPAAGDL
ncbi:MAG: hypothetical protein ACTSSQ_06050 [Alphaproteobacteria bacterium]